MNRFQSIKQTLLSTPIRLCIERAWWITDFFRHHDDPAEPMVIRKAKAFRHLLLHKKIVIFEDELIVGNIGKFRKSAILQPELASIFSCTEILWVDKRKTTPFQISWADKIKLITRIIPFWLPRNMVVRAFWPKLGLLLRYFFDQINPNYYLINEVAGIGHFIPHYEKIIKIGIKGYLEQLAGYNDEQSVAMTIAAQALVDYANRVANELTRLSASEQDPVRAGELRDLAAICSKVPFESAATFHEAVQSLWFVHAAICLESVNSAVSFGRLDQLLYPAFKKDLDQGNVTLQQAKEILLSFSAKTTEHVFLLTEKLSVFHGGFLVAQAAIVGGMDSEGNDAVNELSYLLLEVMAEAGLRDPNYQVRIHKHTSPAFISKAIEVARAGNGSPAFFSDEATIRSLEAHGYSRQEARNYGIVGCVEPTVPGKSFCSTDAALVNLPVCLELALNEGKRFASHKQIGAQTPDPASFTAINDVLLAFENQVAAIVKRLIDDIQIIEQGNRKYHPTPFSSLLVDGCLERQQDLTAGGAMYNSSGIQGVGLADVADSLAALEEVVFKAKRYPLATVIKALKTNFKGEDVLRSYLAKAPKFGNDQTATDSFAQSVAGLFSSILARHRNTRGGAYIAGLYSSTAHVGFGKRTGALPSGRLAFTPFAASLSPVNGADRSGPTAVLNSVAAINSAFSPNGYALNLSFDPHSIQGEKGKKILSSLLGGYFEKGGMELQLNVLDHQRLEEAFHHPGKYPGIVVRVAGYCAFFDDLPIDVKREVLARNRQPV